MVKILKLLEIKKQANPKLFDALRFQMAISDRSFGMRWYVHFELFWGTIKNQGTGIIIITKIIVVFTLSLEEQIRKYEDDVWNMRIVGCFSMTELGHSSHLRGVFGTKKKNLLTIVQV